MIIVIVTSSLLLSLAWWTKAIARPCVIIASSLLLSLAWWTKAIARPCVIITSSLLLSLVWWTKVKARPCSRRIVLSELMEPIRPRTQSEWLLRYGRISIFNLHSHCSRMIKLLLSTFHLERCWLLNLVCSFLCV
jgi:hypothetical protein